MRLIFKILFFTISLWCAFHLSWTSFLFINGIVWLLKKNITAARAAISKKENLQVDDSLVNHFHFLQIMHGNIAAIEFAEKLDKTTHMKLLKDLEGVQELIVRSFYEDESLSNEVLSRVMDTWFLRDDYKIMFKARLAAKEGNHLKLSELYKEFSSYVRTEGIPYNIASFYYHFGCAFEEIGDIENAKYSYEKCVEQSYGVGWADCELRYVRLKHPTKGPDLNIDDPFAVLGVSQASSDEEIKTAYHTLLKQNHPDKVSSFGQKIRDAAEHETKRIISAFKKIKEVRRVA